MKPDDLTASIADAGVVVAIVFGVTGLVVGIIGLIQASRAKAAAIKANQIANEANAIAKEANHLVEIANRVIHQQAERDTERSDVAWEWRWDGSISSEYVVIQNIGKGSAKDVVLQFFFETSVEASSPINVEGREEIRVEIPTLAERRLSAVEAERASVEWAVAQRIVGALSTPPGSTARVRLRVTWVTPRGTPKLHDTGYSDESLLHNVH